MNLVSHPERLRFDDQEAIPSGLARFCNALSDSVRAQVVGALMGGQALPASEIANLLRMSPQATRFHLRVLEDAGLVVVHPCGRHRYYEIASADTAERLESVFGIVAPPPSLSQRRGFTPGFIEARCCYKHLAGTIAVEIASALQTFGHLTLDGEFFRLEPKGEQFFSDLGLSFKRDQLGHLAAKRCIDVTHRHAHIGGPLGASLLAWMLEKDWLRKQAGERAFVIPPRGRMEIRRFVRDLQA